MDYLIIYKYSLCVALTLILFFGFYFLTAPTPEKPIFDNYLRSRRIMGIAILVLAANLLRTFILWYTICKCQGGYINESIHLFSIILAFQFGFDSFIRPILFDSPSFCSAYRQMDIVYRFIRNRTVSVS